MSVDVAVIGAGVSGLTAAYELHRRGYSVTVLERQVRPGGNAISERVGGFLIEHGPSTVNAASAPVAELSRMLGLDAVRCELGLGVRYRYLTRGSRVHRIAVHPLGFLLSDYLSRGARLRMLAEAFVPPRRDGVEETVAEFFGRRFGAEFVERVIDPLTGGLYAGYPPALSMAAVFPALIRMEQRYGSISRGVFKRWLSGGTAPARRLYSWREGVGTLPRALANHLGPAVCTGVAVRHIEPRVGGFELCLRAAGRLQARAVVIATQPHVAATLLEGLDSSAADAAAGIDAPPLAVVFLGYARRQVEHPLDGLGYLTPSAEGRTLSGALFCSTMFPGRAPQDHVGLAGYIGGARAPDAALAPPSELVAAARAEFRDLLGARGQPALERVRQWPRGLPQYHLGHAVRAAALRGTDRRRPGLFVTGNYFAGPSVAVCVAQAVETATRVHRFLADNEAIRSQGEGPLTDRAVG